MRETYPLNFKPQFSLGFGDLVPEELFAGLEAELGIARGDATDAFIGGLPVTYQGEDEDELFAPEGWDWETGAPPEGDRFLLFQDGFGEGHIHFWISRGDLQSGTFDRLQATHSGT